MLAKLLDLNEERAAQERQNAVRWLRPAYQDPKGVSQQSLDLEIVGVVSAGAGLPRFPIRLAEQSKVVCQLLKAAAPPFTAKQVASSFKGVGEARVEKLLETLVYRGQAREVPDNDGYAA